MGYTTTFTGEIAIEPPLSGTELVALREFLDDRYDYKTHPSIHCDWESPDGATIRWNGSEKSYAMPEWLKWLIENKLQGHTLNGEMYAEGEEQGDRWMLIVEDNVVKVKQAKPVAMGRAKII